MFCDKPQCLVVVIIILHSEQDIEVDTLFVKGCQHFFAVRVESVKMDEVNVVEIWHQKLLKHLASVCY